MFAAGARAETGIVTLVEGSPRLLRGATWYKLVAATRVEEADIVEAPDRAQAQIELAAGSVANLVGAGKLHFVPRQAKSPLPLLNMPAGWLKVVAKAPGVRVRTLPFDLVIVEGIAVVRADGATIEVFVESGSAKLIELAPSGADGPGRDIKSGEYVARSATGALSSSQRPPKSFVDALPRHFVDPLPTLAAKIKPKPSLAVDRDITYAEAEPWLAGRDRALFEKRFAGRLRDPAFRAAALPNLARYPSWDRMLHPEKYAPKAEPVK